MTLTEQISRAQEFIWTSARLLDRHLFTYLFADGARQPVLDTLAAYQNSDGGFGNALEPDIRAPISQPQPCEMALHMLDMVDGFGTPEGEQMVQKMCDYLQTISTEAGGVPFVLPSVAGYPRQPWWNSEENPPASVNPTAAIAGLLHKHGVQHPWLEGATAFCWREVDKGVEQTFHSLITLLLFLDNVPERERADAALEAMVSRIEEQGLVEMDPHAEGYVQKPLDWAPTPDRYISRLFSEEVIEANLDALAQRQQEDGGWPISWPAISPAAEAEWRGWVTIGALRTLSAYA